MLCKGRNKALTTVCTLLLHLFTALSAHHRFRTVLSRAFLHVFSFSGVFLSGSLRARALSMLRSVSMRLIATLPAVCAALLPRKH